MLKKTGLQVLVLTLALILFSSDSTAQTRINFRRGRSSATVGGSIGANGGYREYVLRGSPGQVMSIRISSGNGAVTANAGRASGRNFSLSMSGGDHSITAYNSGRATRFTMTVAIR